MYYYFGNNKSVKQCSELPKMIETEMLINWVSMIALELILSRLRAMLKDHFSMYLARLQDLKNGPK